VDALTLLREMYYLPLKYSTRLGVNIFAPGDLEKWYDDDDDDDDLCVVSSRLVSSRLV
jgi:hypothetical protein